MFSPAAALAAAAAAAAAAAPTGPPLLPCVRLHAPDVSDRAISWSRRSPSDSELAAATSTESASAAGGGDDVSVGVLALLEAINACASCFYSVALCPRARARRARRARARARAHSCVPAAGAPTASSSSSGGGSSSSSTRVDHVRRQVRSRGCLNAACACFGCARTDSFERSAQKLIVPPPPRHCVCSGSHSPASTSEGDGTSGRVRRQSMELCVAQELAQAALMYSRVRASPFGLHTCCL